MINKYTISIGLACVSFLGGLYYGYTLNEDKWNDIATEQQLDLLTNYINTTEQHIEIVNDEASKLLSDEEQIKSKAYSLINSNNSDSAYELVVNGVREQTFGYSSKVSGITTVTGGNKKTDCKCDRRNRQDIQRLYKQAMKIAIDCDLDRNKFTHALDVYERVKGVQ